MLPVFDQIPTGIIKPLDYQLTSDYLAGGGGGVGGLGLGGRLLDYEPTWPSSYETSLLHDSLLAQKLAGAGGRKGRLIPGVPASYQAAEYASRGYGPSTTATRHAAAGRRGANHSNLPHCSVDINST